MYEQFYGLTRRPFHLIPDPRFLFPSRGHRRALSYLLYGLEQREGFVVITGDIGAGKTLLIKTLFGELEDRPLATARLAAANLDAESVLPMVAAAFGRPYEGLSKASILHDLEAMLSDDPAYQEGALLVVDEAQTFSPSALEELRILSNFEIDGRALLQLFLVGQSDLREVLLKPEMEQLRQRIIASHHLEPLGKDETQDYIFHRLRAADWDEDPTISNDICSSVFDWSRGLPRRINWLMDRLLLYGYLEELHHLTKADLDTVIMELDGELHASNHTASVQSSSEVSCSSEERVAEQLKDLRSKVDALEKGFHFVLDGYRKLLSVRKAGDVPSPDVPRPEEKGGGRNSVIPMNNNNEAVSRVTGRIAALDQVLEQASPESQKVQDDSIAALLKGGNRKEGTDG